MPPAARPRTWQLPFLARALATVHAFGALTAIFLTLFVGRQVRPSTAEVAFGLINVPAAPTFLSIVVLALVTGALVFRKRIGLWFVAAFQLLGTYLGLVELLTLRLPLSGVWETRGDLGRGLDLLSIAMSGVILAVLWRVRPIFSGRLRRGSWWLAGLTLAAGTTITGAATWVLLAATRSETPGLRSLLSTAVRALTGTADEAHESWAADVAATLLGLTILLAVIAFLSSSRGPSEWTGEHELDIRRLLADYGDDSLGYFATRRDKASIFAPDGRAVVTYRVIAGVSLASGDPIGRPESWGAAIEAWKAEAREYGWVPAALSASEAGATAYAGHGLRVLAIGDEAILDPERFDLRRASMTPVRHAARRAQRAGLMVRLRRQSEISPEELATIAAAAEAWRGEEPDRGFSMALNRAGDPADGRILHVTAHDASGELAGVLSFVPWGQRGVSLDVMRRRPQAPNGVTEFMVSELLTRAPEVGVRRVSLNFVMFRQTYSDAERIGAGSVARVSYSVLGVLDRFWQLERLYRSNEKYEPEWVPRFLCYEDALALPQIAVGAGAAEGFVPWRMPRTTRQLNPEQVRQARALEEAPSALAAPVRRSDQTARRLDRLTAVRAAGVDPYPPSHGYADTPLPALTLDFSPGRQVSAAGRVRQVRDFGGVQFVVLDEQGAHLQVLLNAATMGRNALRQFAEQTATGDLIRVTGRLGTSRTGTPSLLMDSWELLAASLHPIPWRSFTDGDSRLRQRSTDLIVHPDDFTPLRHRAAILAALRATLAADAVMEVETPMLNTIHGGATARPFHTFINAYGVDLTLRIAPELYLKRLVVAGSGPIYELGRNFRNEGADATHNPEFTSLEAYVPGGDYTSMRHLTERLIKAAAVAVHGREVLPMPGPEQVRTGSAGVDLVDISGDWPVVSVLDAVSSAVHQPITLDTDPDVLLALAREHGITVRPQMGPGAIIEELYAELVESATTVPTFYVDFPVETSPLTRPHRSLPGLAERWDLVIAGMELATAYTELTDPLEQRARLTAQSLKAAAGDVEAMEIDEDFLHALELGMPPTGGLGMGVDRLAMLLTNTAIRSVLTFPFVRPDRAAR